jgi:hypothetical protein
MALLAYDLGDPAVYASATAARDVAALRERVTVIGDPGAPVWHSRVRMTLSGGRCVSAERDERTPVAPAERMQRAERKFLRLAEPALGPAAAATVAARIATVEEIASAGELMRMTVPAR